MKRFLSILFIILTLSLPALAEPELIYRTEDVELRLPASWSERILILPTPTGATFYQKASYDKYMEEGISGGGYLFSLAGSVNRSFEELPSFIYLGFCEESAMNYFLELPTDYPAYMDDKDIRAEWDEMHGMMRGIAQEAVIRGSAVKPDSKQYTGLDPWENPLTVTINSITDGKMNWVYVEDFAGQTLVQSFENTEFVNGQAEFHIEAAIQDAEYTTCDYSGTMKVEDDTLTITFSAGEMTEASTEGGSTAYHVEALEEAERTVVLNIR